MNETIFLSVAGLFFSIMTTIIYLFKQNYDSFENKIYTLLNYSNILSICSFLLTVLVQSDLILRIYFVILLSWIALFSLYMSIISLNQDKEREIFVFRIYLFTYILNFIMIFVLPIDIVNEIPSGLAVIYVYLISLIYIIVALFVVLLKKYSFKNKKFFPLFMFIFFGIIVMFIQSRFPNILLITPFESFITVLMYHTIENPDMKMIEQLNSAKEAAEKANRAKTDFLSSMSHEIRTPLNAIVGFSECILKEEDLESVKSDAKDIIMASQNLLEIVNGVLDISKIEADKMEIIETEYNLRENLESLSKLMIPRIGEKPIEFKTKFAPDIPPTLYGDISKIKQIITNILTNAVKYTERGTITFEVNCINRNTSCSIVISVEDTGRGIPADKIDAIFNKFERLEEDRNTTLEGTGLGLAITKRLVEMMGGKIVVQSKYGEGSKFTVYLKQKIRNSTIRKVSQSFVPAQNRDFTSKRVLVVDDNRINLKVATRMLQPFKVMVEECESGEDCLSKIREGRHYDLILMDDMMPKMTGTETLQELKKDSSFHTPVVVLTANAIEGMRAKYLNLGFNDYLAKPIDKTELERVLGQYLSTSIENDIFGPLPEDLFDMTIPLKRDE